MWDDIDFEDLESKDYLSLIFLQGGKWKSIDKAKDMKKGTMVALVLFFPLFNWLGLSTHNKGSNKALNKQTLQSKAKLQDSCMVE